MDPKSLTDEIIEQLLRMPKRVKNPRARSSTKAKHVEQNFDVVCEEGKNEFLLITRQSSIIKASFSCGLLWLPAPGQRVILTRYNGFDHPHSNPIEETKFEFRCHIHKATMRYIQAGRKAEMFAEVTDRYSTMQDALFCLVEDCNIRGFNASDDADEAGQLRLIK